MKLLAVDRFGHIAFDKKVFLLENPSVCCWSGEDDHRNATQFSIGAKVDEHFPAVFLRQVNIEQDQVGARCPRVTALLAQKLEGLLAVAHQRNPAGDLARTQCLNGEARVLQIVFDQQNYIDNATFADYTKLASGVHFLFVNGQATIKDSKTTGCLPGRALRRTKQCLETNARLPVPNVGKIQHSTRFELCKQYQRPLSGKS